MHDPIYIIFGGKHMPSIGPKKKGKNVYYYAYVSKRVNGNPRIVWQKYLGWL